MKIVTLITLMLLGLTVGVFGLNGFVNFLSMRQMPAALAGRSIAAKQGKSHADENFRYALWQTTAQRKQTMSNSISTLLKRNLYDVFGENDSARRRGAMNEIYTDDVVFYESNKSVYRGRDEIDRVAGSLRAQHPDFRYQPLGEPEEAGNGGRIQWVEGRPGEAPVVAGTDFIVTRDGRIAAIYFFFDKRP